MKLSMSFLRVAAAAGAVSAIIVGCSTPTIPVTMNVSGEVKLNGVKEKQLPALDDEFGAGIDRRRGFIEDQDRMVLDHCPGDRHQLFLSGGDRGVVAEHGVVTLRQGFDE